MSEFTLPNGLMLDGVLYNKAYLEDITGKQQNYLVSTKYTSPVDHIERLLFDLLVDLRDESNQSIFPKVERLHLITHLLQIEDLQYLLVKLREITFGAGYYFESKECPHCKSKNSAKIDLGSLEVITYPKPEAKPIELPRSKQLVEYKPMSLSELKAVGANSDKILNNHVTETLKILLAKLGTSTKPTSDEIESLKAADITFITENAPKYDHLDTTITHQCSSCNKDFDFELGEMTPDFFAHSRT